MEGFKANPKMKSQLACFKEGGYVTKKQLASYEKKEQKAEEKKDVSEDKKIVKKAIGQHESAKHKGEDKTEIKLKKGGRAKKETGTVKKYKSGGSCEPKKMAKGGFFNEEPDDATAPLKYPVAKKKPKKKTPPQSKQAQGVGSVSDYEREQIMEMFQGGPKGVGAVSDYEDEMLPGYEDGGMVEEFPAMESGPYSPDLETPVLGGEYLPESQDVFATTTAMPTTAMPTGTARPNKATMRAQRQQMRSQRQAQREAQRAQRQAQKQQMMAAKAGQGVALNTGAMGGAAPAGAVKNAGMSPQQDDLLRGVQAIGKFYRGGQV